MPKLTALKLSSVCIVDASGKIVRETKIASVKRHYQALRGKSRRTTSSWSSALSMALTLLKDAVNDGSVPFTGGYS